MKSGAKRSFKLLEHVFVLAAVGLTALLLTAGLWLQNPDPPQPSDAMVVLGGNFSRPAYAAELYQMGMAKKVFVGRAYRKKGERILDQYLIAYPREEEIYKAVLRKKGVPAEAVEYYGDELLSTVQEAETLAAQLGPGPGKLLVVTSPYHVRRTRMVFADAFPGWEVRVVATPLDPMPAAWWTEQDSARQVILEIPKTLFYRLGGRFRSQ